MKTRTRALLPAAAVALAVLAGCGSAAAPPAPAAASTDPHAGMDMSGMEGMEGMEGMQHGAPGAGLELWAVQTGPLGVTVTDGTGALLYRSDRDTNTPPTSTCTDACLASWQPVVKDGQPPSLLGVNESDVGAVARPDGTQQLTIGGWPVYRHVGEKKGLTDTEANGADGVWFVVSPTGGKAKPTT